ncbi:hypothetical protein [Tenacibaculum amylolyticum]|uniref:hypothetical protein n=1 Tax=Tenacibaculum amylolyticum TaxID=104269 RepID=UPI003895BA63
MEKRVILKLEQNGKDFGYVQLKNDIFYSNGTKEQAVVFELENYHDLPDTHYYRVADTKKGYMDVKYTSSRVQVVEPWISVDLSSICAWKYINNSLRMVVNQTETGKMLSSSQDLESKALYANFYEGKPFKVTQVEVKNANNKSNPELAHAII